MKIPPLLLPRPLQPPPPPPPPSDSFPPPLATSNVVAPAASLPLSLQCSLHPLPTILLAPPISHRHPLPLSNRPTPL
uniref:Uncharacterized protein n=1 Tax=Oryza meridionalis TaxID=40149 RepID=A0A0E0EV62_9ORYZ